MIQFEQKKKVGVPMTQANLKRRRDGLLNSHTSCDARVTLLFVWREVLQAHNTLYSHEDF